MFAIHKRIAKPAAERLQAELFNVPRKARRFYIPLTAPWKPLNSRSSRERLQAIQLNEQEALDASRRRDSVDLAKRTLVLQHEDENTRLSAAESSTQELEQHVHSLQQQLERRIKTPGADLKSAPFRSAANVANLSAYTDVVIVIVTPRWFGVETPDGQRGWLPVDQLESLP